MKPIKGTVNLCGLGRKIKEAEKMNMTPALLIRLLKMYLGVGCNHLVNPQGLFTQASFNQLAMAMKTKSPSELIGAVMKSGWFILGKTPEGVKSSYPIQWFASPFFLDEKQLMKVMQDENAPCAPLAELVSDDMLGDLFTAPLLDSNFGVINSIVNYTGKNNIILSGRTILAESIGALESAGTGNGKEVKKGKKEKNLPESERIEIVNQFIEELRRSKVHRPQLMALTKSLVEPSGEGKDPKREAFSPDEAKEILKIYMYDLVKPYFVDSERFFQIDSFAGRFFWFMNLINSKKGKAMLSTAIKRFKARRTYQERKAQQEAVKNVRSNRPVSPYEWMQEDKRYYEDNLEGILQLPADAPPRPSETAHWNKFTKVWFN